MCAQMTHLLVLLSLIINTVHPQATPLKSVQISPSNPHNNGVHILTNINEVTTINNEWHVEPFLQGTWQFIILIDTTFGFDEFLQSSISITTNSITPTSPQPAEAELLFAFTSTNRQYISAKIPMDNNPSTSNQIYPSCDQSQPSTQLFAMGDIASLPKFNRECDIAGGSCTNWQNMFPQHTHSTPNQPTQPTQPLTFILENQPDTNTFSLYFEQNFIQTCQFGTSFPVDNGIKLYMAGNAPYTISSFEITSAIIYPTDTPTTLPTTSPTNFPTISPTNNPIVSPTNYPTQSPTNLPTKSPSKHPTLVPTSQPTLPTLAPSNNPTNAPTTAFPTTSPTNNPTATAPAPAGFEWGAYKQLCAATPMVQSCKWAGDILMDTQGVVLCLEEYDCCKCASIECGFSGRACTEFRAGVGGVYGVKDIRIAGEVGSSNGVSIGCAGIEACKDTVITASDVNYVDCDGVSACQLAVISVIDPKPSFMLECAGVSACEGLTIDITFSAPPAGFACRAVAMKEIFDFGKIICTDENACHGLQITINNEGCDKVVIQDLECTYPNACNAAVFNFVGDISIETCQCGPSCNNAVGLNQCFENLHNVICSEPYVCQGSTKTITNPTNGFEFVCSNIQSCENANFVIKLDRDLSKIEPVTNLAGFFMGGMHSARGATFTIENTSGLEIIIDRIECGGEGACEGTTFITGNLFIGEINCAANACARCFIRQSITGPAIPCDPQQM